MINQKEAVYNAVMSVFKDHGIKFSDGKNAAAALTAEMRAQVNAILVAGFEKGAVKLDTEFSEQELRTYVSGLQSNWLRKDTRLNGGSKYQAKNPGSRVGGTDAAIKEMRKLLSQVTSKADREEIQRCIEERLTEINKSKTPKVDISVLPRTLHRLAG